jgi:hypothetical protein
MFLGERNDIWLVSLSISEKFDTFRTKKPHCLDPYQVDRDKRVILALVHTKTNKVFVIDVLLMFRQDARLYIYRNTVKEPSPSYAL